MHSSFSNLSHTMFWLISHFQIRVGEHDLGVNDGHEQDISIARYGITVHPQYRSKGNDYDIAVVRLSRSVQFTQRIKPVCINSGIDFTGKVTLFLEQ